MRPVISCDWGKDRHLIGQDSAFCTVTLQSDLAWYPPFPARFPGPWQGPQCRAPGLFPEVGTTHGLHPLCRLWLLPLLGKLGWVLWNSGRCSWRAGSPLCMRGFASPSQLRTHRYCCPTLLARKGPWLLLSSTVVNIICINLQRHSLQRSRESTKYHVKTSTLTIRLN